MADLAFLGAKIVCGGAWGNDKMVWGFLERWWEGAVAHYWCLALGEGEEALGGDFFGAIAFLGALGAARSTRIF